MGAPYHQFCPVAKAMELLDERWTMLLVRELVTGSERFNDLRRGLPRMSPTLLSRRLQQLTRAGLVRRVEDGADVRYVLTEAGRELRPVVEALGAWGTRWIGEIGDADLDPKLLLWDMHRNVDLAAVPSRRTVVRFRFTDPGVVDRDWWLVISPDDVDVCDADPGHPVAASVTGSLHGVTRWWNGDLSWPALVRAGTVSVEAPSGVRRALPGWFARSPFAEVPRPPAAAGRVEVPATR
ncbi:helix-turn-helix domain-containing protein [Kineosporia sp. A_224]|uniref:winged helix-turn-helix transcriptional regulator n=1 Tax=Kineosporia sp. A_224 TaxID=1962180 RepID=UPI000B4A79E2|nr:helix-turn-helix domain-containing protein [Kineosporia sp. A_224]